MLTLFSYNVSPYAAKVRAVLRYKGVPFEERMVHPLQRGEVVRRSGQIAVPVIDDDGTVVADSTRIVAFLDERYPARPVIPRDPALRARALLLEEGFDEGLGRTVQPVRWMIEANARRSAARFRSAYAPGLAGSLRMALVSGFLRLDMRRKYGSRMLGAPPAATLLARLGELIDIVEAALAESGWLAGPAPSVADFALFGWLTQLDGLDGWDVVQSRPRLARLMQALAEPAQPAADAARDGAGASPSDVGRRVQRTDEPPPAA
ncbi:MAG: Glutathione S-transferase domain protein [bacterium]|nr:Glutathione S-transferase domain protein [bacterium]